MALSRASSQIQGNVTSISCIYNRLPVKRRYARPRGEKSVVRAGETVNIPANAPHFFQNTSERPVRLLCMCSPAGLEEFFMKVGVPVASRTAPPPKLDEAAQAAFKARAEALAPRYRTQLFKARRELATVTRVEATASLPIQTDHLPQGRGARFYRNQVGHGLSLLSTIMYFIVLNLRVPICEVRSLMPPNRFLRLWTGQGDHGGISQG